MNSDIVNNDYATDAYKCNGCGAPLVYKPGSYSLICEHCGSSQDISQAQYDIIESDFETYMDKYEKENFNTVKLVVCSNCKATPTVDENLASMHCPYCHSPLIEQDVFSDRYIKPEYLYPFQVNKNEIPHILKKWVDGLWFAPNVIKKAILSPLNLQGIYAPYWTYDAHTDVDYVGQRGTDYTTTVGSGKNRRTVTRTSWTRVRGGVSNFHDDILIRATRSLDISILHKIENWDTKSLVEYNTAFLSGFITEKYQVDLKEGFQRAKEQIHQIEEWNVKRDIGGDHQRIEQMNVKISDVKFKHILLPLYVSAFQFRNQTFAFYINGITGQISGKRPYSKIKIAMAIIAGLIALAAIYYFFFYEK